MTESRQFTVYGTFQVGQDAWPISYIVTAEGSTLAEMRGDLAEKVAKIARFGVRPAQPTQTPAAVRHSAAIDSRPGTPDLEPAPFCKEHRKAMIPSKFKSQSGGQQFYCPVNDDGVYCTHRAEIPKGGGLPRFYEVKK